MSKTIKVVEINNNTTTTKMATVTSKLIRRWIPHKTTVPTTKTTTTMSLAQTRNRLEKQPSLTLMITVTVTVEIGRGDKLVVVVLVVDRMKILIRPNCSHSRASTRTSKIVERECASERTSEREQFKEHGKLTLRKHARSLL